MYEVLLALYLTCILMIQFTWLDEILSKIESMYISKDWTFEKEFINFNDFQGSAYFESIEWFWSDIEAHTRRIIEKLDSSTREKYGHALSTLLVLALKSCPKICTVNRSSNSSFFSKICRYVLHCINNYFYVCWDLFDLWTFMNTYLGIICNNGNQKRQE